MPSTEFVYITYIKSTQQKVWDAITKPEFTKQYWGCAIISDWTVGAMWHAERNTDGVTNMSGEVLESSPPNKLSYTWHFPEMTAEPDKSRVTFDIEAIGETVKLTVTHDKLELGSNMANSISQGWPLVLSSLKSFLETGAAFDIFAIKGACDGASAETKKEKVAR